MVLPIAAAAILLAVTLLGEYVVGSNTLATIAGSATIAVGGIHDLREALQALRAGRLAFVQLLVLAVVGAVILGVIEEAATLVVVYSLGDVLEAWVAHRARRSLRSLMDLVPATARRRRLGGGEELVAVRELSVGDRVLVRPGERLPTDGVVRAGASAVDQSAVTGESIPVEVVLGSEVFGGTVNGNGALEVEVSREYEDTTLARVIRQVEDAQANKGSAQRFADRFGARYTPVVVSIAAAVAVMGPLLGGDVRTWIYRSLVVLVVSCSCALLISVPTAVVAAITRGARDGILIRGGAFLEALAGVRTVAFDKTGTLTEGRPVLTDVRALNGLGEREVLRLAAAVEAVSEHPLGAAVLAGARERGITWSDAADAEARPGAGIFASVGGQRLFAGRPELVAGALDRELAPLRRDGKTVIALARDDQPLGLLAVADRPRPASRSVVEQLHRLGVERVVMLTGDHEQVARAISDAAGIDEWRAGLLPHEKSHVIEELHADAGPVAMVGDGINDAPALALADVGIAMGASGTTVALETADVALMADELEKLPAAIVLARRAMRTVHQNVAMSLVAVVALVAAALAGLLTLTSGLLLNEGTAPDHRQRAAAPARAAGVGANKRPCSTRRVTDTRRASGVGASPVRPVFRRTQRRARERGSRADRRRPPARSPRPDANAPPAGCAPASSRSSPPRRRSCCSAETVTRDDGVIESSTHRRSITWSPRRTPGQSPAGCSRSSVPGHVRVARRIEDLDIARNDDGPPLAVLHLERAEAIDPQLEALDLWHAAGLRSLGPVWSRANAFAHGVPFISPSTPDLGPGLTDAGIALARRCAELGILVDVSHLNEAGFWDIARLELGPIVATHSAAHAVTAASRNLTDHQPDAIGSSGGLVGIVFASRLLRADYASDPDTQVELIATHARYVANRIGIQHVALGSDFDSATIPAAIGSAAGMPTVLDALARDGSSETEIDAVASDNWRRVLQAWWAD